MKDVIIFLTEREIKAQKSINNPDLVEYAQEGNINEIKELLSQGVDINSEESSGNTAIHTFNDLDTLNFLVSNGIDINRITKLGNTALHTHSEDDGEIILELLKLGVNKTIKNKKGYSACEFIFNANNTECMDELRLPDTITDIFTHNDYFSIKVIKETPSVTTLNFDLKYLEDLYQEGRNYLSKEAFNKSVMREDEYFDIDVDFKEAFNLLNKENLDQIQKLAKEQGMTDEDLDDYAYEQMDVLRDDITSAMENAYRDSYSEALTKAIEKELSKEGYNIDYNTDKVSITLNSDDLFKKLKDATSDIRTMNELLPEIDGVYVRDYYADEDVFNNLIKETI